MAGISTPIDGTSYLAFLKKYYIGKKALYQLDDYKTPLVGMMKKDTNFGGSTWEQTYGVTNVVGGTYGAYSNAYANSSQGVDAVASGRLKNRYTDFKVQNSLVRQCMNDGSIVPVMKRKIDSLKSEFFQTINKSLYSDEGGSKCQLAAVTGALAVYNGTVTATDPTKANVQFIKPGMVLNMGNNLDGTTLESNVGTPLTISVTGRGVTAGTFTYTAGSANAHPSGSAYVFEGGSAGLALCGLPSWCPLTDTLAATAFKGLTRATDINGLGGIRVAGVGETIEETILDAISQHRALGGDPDAVLIAPKNMSRLRKELSGRIQWVETKGKAMVGGNNSFGFKGLEVNAGGRPVVCYEDPACPTNVTWVIETDTYVLRSAGAWPYVPSVMDGGGVVNRLPGTDLWQSELFGDLEAISARPASLLAICHDTAIV